MRIIDYFKDDFKNGFKDEMRKLFLWCLKISVLLDRCVSFGLGIGGVISKD